MKNVVTEGNNFLNMTIGLMDVRMMDAYYLVMQWKH